MSIILFDASTLRYSGLVTAGTIYKELNGRGASLHLHAMLLFNGVGASGGSEAMSQKSRAKVLAAICRLDNSSIIDQSGKDLIKLLCECHIYTADVFHDVKSFLSAYLHKEKVLSIMLTTRLVGGNSPMLMLSDDTIIAIGKAVEKTPVHLDPAVKQLPFSAYSRFDGPWS